MWEFLTHAAWAERIGWVLVHSLWQFALVAFAAVVLQRALQRCSAATRHGTLLAALFVMVALPVATWFSPWSADAPRAATQAGPVETPAQVPAAQQGSRPARPAGAMPLRAVPVASPRGLATEPPPERPPLPAAASSWGASLSLVERHVQPWLPEIVLVWLAGVLLAALRPVLSWYTVRRLRTVGVLPVGDALRKLLARTAKRLRVARAVEVLQSALVRTPVVVGYFRPAILLPLCVVSGVPEPQLELILAHELAHIRRHDYLINLLQTVVETLFFYHPAVWWLSGQIRNERENCCDDVAMATLGNRADYGRALLAIEELRAASTTLSLAAHGGSLLARIRRIAGCEPAPRMAGGGILCAVLASLAIVAAVTWAAAESKGELPSTGAGAWKAGQILDFRVINARTNEPLPGVRLDSQFHGPGIKFQDIKTQTTDAQGRAAIKLPDRRPDAVRVYPSKAGFVPLRVYWGDDLPSPKLPKSVTVPMEPGMVWGGVVRNEQGEPIANVKVHVRYWERGSSFNPHLRVNIDDDIEGVTTDKAGRWRMDILPAKFTDNGPLIYLTHPDYVSDHLGRGYSPRAVTERPSYQALREQTAVMVLRKGVTITGRVTDASGKPLRGAVVAHQEECYAPGSYKNAATTNELGHFRLTGLNNTPETSKPRSPETVLTVQAPGYAPRFVEASLSGSAPLEIALERGQAVQGQVVDENGKPVVGVSIWLDYWMGHPRRLPLRTTTDAEGKFRIHDAPLGRTEYTFDKKGYIEVRKPLPPTTKDYQIKLRPPLRIVGSIVDAQTKQPLAECRLTKGWDPDDRAPDWETEIGLPAQTITNGRYEIEVTQEQWFIRIRVEADGYMPAVSRLFRPYDPDRGQVTCDFQLTKAAPMSGTVLGPDDQPLAGAEVFRATKQFVVENRAASPNARRTSRMVKTDAQGRFAFPPEVEPFYLVVLHGKGHVVLDEKQFAATPTFRIAPWTAQNQTFLVQRKQNNFAENSAPANGTPTLAVRIVNSEGQPVEGANVATSAMFRTGYNYLGANEPAWEYFHNVVSDHDGRARIVYQGRIDCVVARHVERKLVAMQSVSPEQSSAADPLTLTMHRQCAVSGRLTAKGLEAHHHPFAGSSVYVYLPDGMGRPLCCMSSRGDYHFCLPPGTFTLDANGTDTQQVRKTITVKPGQEQLDVEPIDLPPAGLILLEGQPAPELREIVAWKNGGPVKLADLRGKVVLLAFSANWSGPRLMGLVPDLLPVYDKYHDQGLVIIDVRFDLGLEMDTQAKLEQRVAEVKAPFWKDRDIPAPIALVRMNRVPLRSDKESAVPVLSDYGITGFPTAVLIDRQGRVVGRFDPRLNRDQAARDAILEKVLKAK